MPVKLRLRRIGAKHQPRYRIVAADSRSPRDGRFIEVIGYYLPTRQPHEVVIDAALAQKWLKNGAQPTDTVRDLLVQQGLLAAEPYAVSETSAQSKSVEPAAEPAPQAAPEPAAAEPAAEAGAEEGSSDTDTSA